MPGTATAPVRGEALRTVTASAEERAGPVSENPQSTKERSSAA
jgi:hypothetical protein